MRPIFLLLLISCLWGCTPQVTAQPGANATYHLTVALDGSGDYLTVQAAIDAAPDLDTAEFIIFIKKGVYQEKVLVPGSKTHLTLLGEDVDSTIIVWDDYSGRVVDSVELGTSTSYTFRTDPDYFKAQNLTFENSATVAAQAVALLVNGDKNIFYHCKMVGNQDTYYTKGYGRLYMKDCYIEGTTDFIFGRAVSVFDSCYIVSKKTSYITAASTEEEYAFGYVFFDCQLAAIDNVFNVSLGRPWRPYAQTVFIRSYLDRHIAPSGWSEWNGNDNHLTTFYAEYQCVGPRADRTYRKDWTMELSETAAAAYTLANIFAQTTAPNQYSDDWLPQLDSLPYPRYVNFNASTRIADLRESLALKPYPNPAQDHLTLSLTLPQATEVQLSLLDQQGRAVHTFASQRRAAGEQSLTYDLPPLAPGLYAYRLQVGDQPLGGVLRLERR